MAALLVFILHYFFQDRGLQALCYFAVIAGTRELSRMLFLSPPARWLPVLFAVLVFLVFGISAYLPEFSGLAFAIATIILCFISVVAVESFDSLDSVVAFIGKGLLGFVYVGLIPSFAFRMFDLTIGMHWFIFMLVIVFVGDTCAYLTGLTMGKRKLLPPISPKKTIEGSLGGLAGSVISAMLLASWLPPAPLWLYGIMGACVGVVAQMGDLFESLLKRVADRKDSGTLMPGHGGVLDRLDGILFASPVVFLFATLTENYFR